MKNKARLSTMTAFSFGKQHTSLGIDQLNPLKRATVTVFFLRFMCPNETTKSSLMPTQKTPLITMQCQPFTRGGIVLFCLLVPV